MIRVKLPVLQRPLSASCVTHSQKEPRTPVHVQYTVNSPCMDMRNLMFGIICLQDDQVWVYDGSIPLELQSAYPAAAELVSALYGTTSMPEG